MPSITKVYELDKNGEYKQITTLSSKRKNQNKINPIKQVKRSKNSKSPTKKRPRDTTEYVPPSDTDSDISDDDFIIDGNLNNNISEEIRETIADRKNFTELLEEYNEGRINDADTLWNKFKFNKKEKKTYNALKSVGISSNKFASSATEKQGWVSATAVKNYMFSDPLLDWLDRYYELNKITLYDTFINQNENQRTKRRRMCTLNSNKITSINETMTNLKGNNDSLSVLFANGIEFEEKVNNELRSIANIKCRDHIGSKFVTVFTQEDYHKHKKRTDMKVMKLKMKETIAYMNEGIPIISQAVLMNTDNHTYGVADILIRGDYINEFFSTQLEDDNLLVGAPKLKTNTHYRVIDIKWTTMTLCVNGLNLRNDNRIPAYKAQLAIYNAALGNIQGYTPTEAYVMSKAWFIDSKNYPERGYSCFDRLGVVDYDGFDKKYIESTKEAIKWVHKVSLVGRTWNLKDGEPDIPEMYPNMCNKNDGVWEQVKKKIADNYDEITNVWYVGVKHREVAHAKGIFKISDPKCDTSALGIDKGTRKITIDNILSTNRSVDNIVNPQELTNFEFLNWLQIDDGDYYVDFETINGALQVCPNDIDIRDSKSDSDITFMVGIGYNKQNNISTKTVLDRIRLPSLSKDICGVYCKETDNWEYVCFYMKESCIEQEKSIYQKFITFIQERKKLIKEIKGINTIVSNNLFHWTVAEPKFMESSKKRHYDPISENPEDIEMVKLYNNFSKECSWLDLYKMFTSVPITIKKCYNFKLKSVTKALYDNKLIHTTWPDNGIAEGLGAMFSAIDVYKQIDKGNVNEALSTHKVYKSIIDYNEIDCKAMWDIKRYLITKYVNNDRLMENDIEIN